jgi:parallel beta-helix repeat protein
MGRGSVQRVLAIGTIALSSSLGLAAPAMAKKVQCGDVITADTKVSNDLKNCPDDGLVVGADDVTLDLNGHTIDGDESGLDSGILIDGHDGVTVKNGTLKQFEDGVSLEGGSDDNLIKSITSHHNTGLGISLLGDNDDNALVRNTTHHNFIGLAVTGGSDGNILRGNTADKNRFTGLQAGNNAFRTVFLANRATRNGTDGIHVVEPDNGTSIRDNRANDNGDDGIEVPPEADDAGGNRAHGNGDRQCIGVACS